MRKNKATRRDILKSGAGHCGRRDARSAGANGCTGAERCRPCPCTAEQAYPAQRRHHPFGRSEGRRFRIRRRADRGRQDPRNPSRHCRNRCSGCRCHEPHPHPRLCRHPQPFLSGPAALEPRQRPGRSRLQPRRPEQAHACLYARRRLCRRADHRARLHRDGHDRDHRSLADQPHARAPRRRHPRAAGVRHPRGLRLFARGRAEAAMAAGYRPHSEDLFQLEGPAADAGAGDRASTRRWSKRRAPPACRP